MPGVSKTGNFANVTAREMDFVTRFNDQWDALTQILGIMRPIRKPAGTTLKAYKAVMVDSALQTSPAEGVDITFTEFGVDPVSFDDLTVEKYGKSTSIEAVEKYGAEIAVQKTDDKFLVELQNKVLSSFYAELNKTKDKLVGTQKTWQRAMAMAKGAVLEEFAKMNKAVTEVVAFVNVMDVYDYLGDAPITVQSQFGLQYIKDFMGYSTVFLLPSNYIASKKVIALPVENLDLYYIDPSDSDFAQLGLQYTVAGETNLIGFHAEGNYRNATGECYALMGMALWAEYTNGIAIATVGSSNTAFTISQS